MPKRDAHKQAESDNKIILNNSNTPQILIQCLRNNIMFTVTNPPSNILFKLSAGLIGYKNAAKTSTKSALALIDVLQEKLSDHGISEVKLNFRGINTARSVIIGQLRGCGLKVKEIIDTTGVPHNGCRPKKARRL